MKKFSILLIMAFSCIILCTSCQDQYDTEAMAVNVSKSMKETWEAQGLTGLSIEKITLKLKKGDLYDGVLEVIDNGEAKTYPIEVTYDGTNLSWKILQ